METISQRPILVNASRTKRRQELVQKVLVERSVPTLERMLVIGACKYRKFYRRLKELDVAPHISEGVPAFRRRDFTELMYNRAFAVIADWRDLNETAVAIRPELLETMVVGVINPVLFPGPEAQAMIDWLKPELAEPEWENPIPIFSMLNAQSADGA